MLAVLVPAALGSAVAWSAGCGYALAGRGSFLPADVKVVAILPFVNQTPYNGIDQVITRKVREEFIGRGKFKILNEAPGADALLNGTILAISTVPAGVTDQQLASRYRVTMVLKVTFTKALTNEVIWANDQQTFTGEYEIPSVNVQAATFVDQAPNTIDRIASDAARSTVTAIVEAF